MEDKTKVYRFWSDFIDGGALGVPTESQLSSKEAMSFVDELLNKDGEIANIRGVLEDMMQLIAHAVPNHKALDATAEFIGASDVLSIGCGMAFWERQLQSRGKRVHVTDKTAPNVSYMPITACDATEAVKRFPTDCLFVAWPTAEGYDSAALAAFQGNKVIVICQGDHFEAKLAALGVGPRRVAETLKRCSVGSPAFWTALSTEWKLEQTVHLPRSDDKTLVYDPIIRFFFRAKEKA